MLELGTMSNVHATGPVMGGVHSVELVHTKPVLWEQRCTGCSPRGTVRRMPMSVPATLVTIPSVCVLPHATPLGGSLVRNVLVLERCVT